MMADKEYLYSKVDDNQKLKDAVAEVGVTVKFDRSHGAYELITEGVDQAKLDELRTKLAPYQSAEAKAEWAADRERFQADKAALKSAAKSRENTTQEPKPELAPNTLVVYPAPSQKPEYRRLLEVTKAKSSYTKASEGVEAHFVVVTDQPDKFAKFTGPEAQERFKREFAEKGSDLTKNVEMEELREHVAGRGAKAFMAQYAERGFRLSDPKASPEAHASQLVQMRDASSKQLIKVLSISRQIRDPLLDKEAAIRAAVAGISVEQLKAMSWQDQKEVSLKDGKPVGLVGDDFKLNSQLSKGISAIMKELEARGVGQARDNQQEKEPEKAAEQDKSQSRPPRSMAKGPRGAGAAVDEDHDVANALATLQAAGRSRGR